MLNLLSKHSLSQLNMWQCQSLALAGTTDNQTFHNNTEWSHLWHLEYTFKERSLRLVTFETFDQSDEKTWPDQQKDNDKDKYKDKHNDKDKYI